MPDSFRQSQQGTVRVEFDPCLLSKEQQPNLLYLESIFTHAYISKLEVAGLS